MEEVVRDVAHCLRFGEAVHLLGARVPTGNDPVRILNNNGVMRKLDQLGLPLQRIALFAQFRLRLLALGDVLGANQRGLAVPVVLHWDGGKLQAPCLFAAIHGQRHPRLHIAVGCSVAEGIRHRQPDGAPGACRPVAASRRIRQSVQTPNRPAWPQTQYVRHVLSGKLNGQIVGLPHA